MNALWKELLIRFGNLKTKFPKTKLGRRVLVSKRVVNSIPYRRYFKNYECIRIAEPIDLRGDADCVSFGDGAYIGHHTVIEVWKKYSKDRNPRLVVGGNACIGEYNHITCVNCIQIGENLLTGRWVTISDNNHGDNSWEQMHQAPASRPVTSKGPVIIGDNVWLGEKVTVVSGVTIGDGSVIAANSVVTKDIPAFCVAGGCPAVVIKQQCEIVNQK